MITLFKRRSPLSPEERRVVLADRLRQEKEWAPIIEALFSGKYGPEALDTNIWIWDYEAIFKDAYQDVADLGGSREKLRDAVLQLLSSKKQWYRLAAQDLAKEFLIHEAEPYLLQQISSPLKLFSSRGPSIFDSLDSTELKNLAYALEGLGRAKDIGLVLKQWIEYFLAIPSNVFKQWSRIGRGKKEELLGSRELFTTGLQIFGRIDVPATVEYLKQLAVLGSEIHVQCCESQRWVGVSGQRRCDWLERALLGLVEKSGSEEVRRLLVEGLHGVPRESSEPILNSIEGASTNARQLQEIRKLAK